MTSDVPSAFATTLNDPGCDSHPFRAVDFYIYVCVKHVQHNNQVRIISHLISPRVGRSDTLSRRSLSRGPIKGWFISRYDVDKEIELV